MPIQGLLTRGSNLTVVWPRPPLIWSMWGHKSPSLQIDLMTLAALCPLNTLLLLTFDLFPYSSVIFWKSVPQCKLKSSNGFYLTWKKSFPINFHAHCCFLVIRAYKHRLQNGSWVPTSLTLPCILRLTIYHLLPDLSCPHCPYCTMCSLNHVMFHVHADAIWPPLSLEAAKWLLEWCQVSG